MSKLTKLEQVRKIKELRKTKAETALRRATAEARDLQQRAAKMRQKYEMTQERTATYAQDRFMKLAAQDQRYVFFTSMALGLFRQRRDVASLGLRAKRLDNDHRISEINVKKASAACARATRSENMISQAAQLLGGRIAIADEQTAEEEILELVANKDLLS